MRREFIVYADYTQIHIEDSSVTGKLFIPWDDQAVFKRIVVNPNKIIIGTARSMEVPLTIEVFDARPKIELSEWDHVIECSVNIPSGILHISGTTDYIEDVNKIELTPGLYGAIVCYGGLQTISEDGLSGKDRYSVSLWQSRDQISMKALKQYR